MLSVYCECLYLTCLADAAALSFVLLSAAGVDSPWLETTAASDWTARCCLVISVVLATHSAVEDVAGAGVAEPEEAAVCDVWLTVSCAGCGGGVGAASDAGGCEAHFCTAASVAGGWGRLSGSVGSTAADWLGLCCCVSGTTAGSLAVAC